MSGLRFQRAARPGAGFMAVLVSALAAAALAVAAGGAATTSGVIVFAATRGPDWDGEIFRVDLQGHRIDLSNDPARDVLPSVSPDGKTVAFASSRGGAWAIWVVGVTGGVPRRVSPPLAAVPYNATLDGAIAWSPNGRMLAVDAGVLKERLWLAHADGTGWHAVTVAEQNAMAVTWSADSKLLAYASANSARVVDAAGRSRWHVAGYPVGWGRNGLGVSDGADHVTVYDERGRRLARWPAGAVAWSPDGRDLATLQSGVLRVRRGGTGPSFVNRRYRNWLSGPVPLQWLSSTRIRVASHGYDIVHRRAYTLSGAFAAEDTVPARNGAEAFSTRERHLQMSLLVTRSGTTRTLTTAPVCGGGQLDAVQPLPGGTSVVYETLCPRPPADVYAVAPDGSGLRQLTNTPSVDEIEPALSSTGLIAYSSETETNLGCLCRAIWTLPLAGGTPSELAASAAGPFHDDEYPSFSPDGKTLVFSRSTNDFSAAKELVAPVTGGAAHSIPTVGGPVAWGTTRIAFAGRMRAADGTIQYGIFTAQPNGSDVRRVAVDAGHLHQALAWSADGRLAVLDVEQATATTESIYLPATGARIALHGISAGRGLAWSPDGTRFAFDGYDAEGVPDIWTIGVDGTDLQRVTRGLGAWSSLGWR